MSRCIEMNGGFRKKHSDEEKHLMTRLEIAIIACGSALILTSFIGIYIRISSSGPHPYWTAWFIVLCLTFAGLSFASVLREWKKRH